MEKRRREPRRVIVQSEHGAGGPRALVRRVRDIVHSAIVAAAAAWDRSEDLYLFAVLLGQVADVDDPVQARVRGFFCGWAGVVR